MLNRKIQKIGPFVCYTHWGNKGDFQVSDSSEILVDADYDGPVVINGELVESGYDKSLWGVHNMFHMYVSGSFECRHSEGAISTIKRRGDCNYKVHRKNITTTNIALEDNSSFRCYFPWMNHGYRWCRIGGLAQPGDILYVPVKNTTQYVILCDGSIEIDGTIYDKHMALKIVSGDKRKITVKSETLWLRVWPDLKSRISREDDIR